MNNLNNNAEDRFVVSDKDIKWGINGQQKTEEEINRYMAEKRKKLQEVSLDKYMIIGSVVEIHLKKIKKKKKKNFIKSKIEMGKLWIIWLANIRMVQQIH